MVTVSACAIALLALAIFIYCEVNDYHIGSVGGVKVSDELSPNTSSTTSNAQQPVGYYQMPRNKADDFFARCRAVFQFAKVVFFTSATDQKELVRRNELTAEKLLEDYQKFITLPPEERVDRFLKWRDDIAYFESHKQSPLSIKSDVVEFKVD